MKWLVGILVVALVVYVFTNMKAKGVIGGPKSPFIYSDNGKCPSGYEWYDATMGGVIQFVMRPTDCRLKK